MRNELVKKGSILDGDELKAEYRIRNKPYFEISLNKNAPVPSGWEIKREFKTRVRLSKKKPLSVELEDKVWRLFYELGINRISSRHFSLVIKTRDGIPKIKQLDVVAFDENIVFVVECKSQEKFSKKSLKKDISEFADNMNDITNAIKSLLGIRRLKFIFILATENIDLDENDKLDAKERNILVLDEYDLLSLQNLANLGGEGAKYQIYNRIFHGKKIKDFQIRVPALKAKMGGLTYYSFVLRPQHLLKIAYVHHRLKKFGFIELSDSYQRMLKKTRIRRIEEFIRDGGFFPGSIIINFRRGFVKEETLGDKQYLSQLHCDAKPVVITLPPYYGCAWIIDGQHRLYGYADTEEKKTETLPVVAFVEKSNRLPAKIFVDINKNQKPIEASLLWDLYEDLYSSSTDSKEQQLYAISKIAKKLGNMRESPFFGDISIPKEQNEGNISLTTVCSSINQQRLIVEGEKLLFHNSYEETISFAAERISQFFCVIKDTLLEEWNLGEKHYIRTNAGFVVLLGIMRDIVECNLAPLELENIDKFKERTAIYLDPLLLHFLEADDATIGQYRGAGGAGESSRQVRYELTKKIFDANIGFGSRWLESYDQTLKEERETERRRKGIKYYLEQDENEFLEFKGSLLLHVDRYLLGDGKMEEDQAIAYEGVLKAIVGFLNKNGGDIVIGILEKNRFEKVVEEENADYPIYNDKIIFGIENEYGKDGWDGYYRRLMDFIEKRIASDIIDGDLVKIKKLNYEDKDLCLIRISPAGTKQYLDNGFFIRRGNTTVQLKGQEIDQYFSRRSQ